MDIRVEALTVAYGNTVAVIDLDLKVEQGEMLVLLGPSGCGKTTTMRCIAGLEQAKAGRISIGDRVVVDTAKSIHVPANRRNIGMVFQSYAVWPHMTVAENVGFPLVMQRLGKAEIRKRVEETLQLVGLEGFADRGASKLSGGQMQRVALARSIVMKPAVLLLDEPLSNLDAKLRDRLRLELRAIQLQTGITSIFVTHDQHEALALADRIAVMRDGRIVQLDEPKTMYRQPNSPFVADFLGATNIFDGAVAGGGEGEVEIRLDTGDVVRGVIAEPAVLGNRKTVAIRPETIQLNPANGHDPAPNLWLGRVQVASFLGSQIAYRLRMQSGLVLEVNAADTLTTYRPGDMVAATMSAASVNVLPPREDG